MADAALHALPIALPDLGAARQARTAWMLVAPAIVLMIAFIIAPLVAVVFLGFTDFELGYGSFRFIGFENYAELLSDRTFRASVYNTTIYTAIVAPVSLLLGLGLALLVESEPLGRSFFRTAFFLPVVSLIVAMATVWEYLLHPSIGPVNAALRLMGMAGPNWFGGSDTVLYSLAIVGIWQSVGYNMVLFLAGLTAIPRDLYAAADIDGAKSGLDRFFLVTWPMLGPTTLFVVTISVINAVKVFETVRALTQGGPNNASEVLLFTIYKEGFVYLRVGYASAMTIVFLAVLVILMFLQYHLLDREVHYT